MFAGSSLDLPSRRDFVPLQSSRFLSIDAGHLDLLTFGDLQWGASSLKEGGVVVLDDIHDPEWPGVPRGLRGFFHLIDPYWPRQAHGAIE